MRAASHTAEGQLSDLQMRGAPRIYKSSQTFLWVSNVFFVSLQKYFYYA